MLGYWFECIGRICLWIRSICAFFVGTPIASGGMEPRRRFNRALLTSGVASVRNLQSSATVILQITWSGIPKTCAFNLTWYSKERRSGVHRKSKKSEILQDGNRSSAKRADNRNN